MWKSIKKFFDLKKEGLVTAQKSQAERVFDELSHKIEMDEEAVKALEVQTRRGMLAIENAVKEDVEHVEKVLG